MDAADEPLFDSKCAICWDQFEEGDMVRELPCHHTYHAGCIDPWIVASGRCPQCRKTIFTSRNREAGGKSSHLRIENERTPLL